MRSRSTDENIDELTSAINRLRLAQEHLENVISRLNRERTQTEQTPERIEAVESRPRRQRFQIGDNVQIINPRPFQEDHGVVVGFTRAGFVQIQTPDGSIISRIPRNLRHRQTA